MEIPPRHPGLERLRLRHMQRLRHLPRPNHRGHQRRHHLRHLAQPPPSHPHPPLGPNRPHRHPHHRRRPHRRPPPRRCPRTRQRRQRLRVVHQPLPREGWAWSRSTYTYTNVQHAGNLWYHDHALGLTRENLLAGLLGMYVIRDPALEAPLNLPSGEEFDRHLVIADRSFYSDGSIFMNSTGNVPYIHPQWQPEYFGEAMTVNGKAWPFLAVQRRKYRFRIINVSNARYLNLNFSNGLNFTVIGSDTSYLPAPIVTPTLLLSPAEIFDVIVDFNATTTNETILQNDSPYPYPNGTPAGPLHQTIMKFSISPNQPITPDNSTIPTTLINYPTSLSPTVTRYITMYEYLTPSNQSTHLSINGLRLEDPATETPVTGSTELWEVINLTGDDHPLHLHLAMFQATKTVALVDPDVFVACMNVSNDAVACNITGHATGKVTNVPEHEKAWKNVVKIAPMSMTTVIVKFNLVEGDKPYPFDATSKPDYVYHCHILDHEDNAMIRPLKLVAPLLSAE
ncbi:hypothetical protein QJS10_CPB12g00330 [Acorus calamus]|uniref:Laccase n=1 Tax=Acorus calamus TaxID=4465 RepID=A0AAV9DLV1_ACOCL|nr:hypothetical protein QJS10_CPB12g00330 [Acorus calamus]